MELLEEKHEALLPRGLTSWMAGTAVMEFTKVLAKFLWPGLQRGWLSLWGGVLLGL